MEANTLLPNVQKKNHWTNMLKSKWHHERTPTKSWANYSFCEIETSKNETFFRKISFVAIKTVNHTMWIEWRIKSQIKCHGNVMTAHMQYLRCIRMCGKEPSERQPKIVIFHRIAIDSVHSILLYGVLLSLMMLLQFVSCCCFSFLCQVLVTA